MPVAIENVCLSEALSGFAADVSAGLSRSQKELPAKYLYDEIGSALFEAITVLPEYGLTRAEARLLHQHADEIARWLPSNVSVAELGSGSGRKTRPVLQAIASLRDSVRYHAIDVSQAALDSCCGQLNSLSGVDVQGLHLPYLEGLGEIRGRRHGDECLLVLFLGSSIGNFEREQAARFLSGIRKRLQPGDALLLGADLVKPRAQLLTAYDDPAGVTAAFNLNLLGRINRELGANFGLRNFQHEVRWCASERRIEMHLCSTTQQVVEIPGAGCQVRFDAGETIWTESSHKCETAELSQLAAETGFISVARWMDGEWPFVESLWIA
jgi:L-histidine Nalpha-methyltransferase